MNNNSKSFVVLGFCLFAPSIPVRSQSEEDVEEPAVYELSPFAVEEEDGYTATTTLAGSRVRSNLRDLGASIAVITQEFMADIGATDGESLLAFVGNVEVGGVQGNFSDVNPGSSSTNDSRVNPQESQRIRGLESATLTRGYFQTNIGFDAYNTSRVTVNRGPNSILFGLGTSGGVINNNLSRAQIGSNFGEISVRIDHRGGHRKIVDYNKTIIKDRFAVRISYLNESLKFQQEPAFEKDERFYITWDLTLFKNENLSWLGKTSLRGSFEGGEILRNPPDVVPPRDGFSSWFEGIGGQEVLNNILRVPGTSLSNIDNRAATKEWVLGAIAEGLVEVPESVTAEEYASVEGQFIPMTEYNRITRDGRNNSASGSPYFIWPAINFNSVAAVTEPGWDSPELTGIQGIMARWRPNGFPLQDLRWSAWNLAGPGYVPESLKNRNVFDYHNLLFQGSTNEVLTDFDAHQFFLEQELFGGNAGIELAWDQQSSVQTSQLAFSSGTRGANSAPSKNIYIDITSHHAPADSDFDGIADRTPNENVGRPVALWSDTRTELSRTEQETFRATLFGTLDTRDFFEGSWGSIFGSHILTGLYEDRTNDSSFRATKGVWWADEGDFPGDRNISNGANDHFRRQMNAVVYLGPDVRGLSSADDVRIDGYIDVRVPQVGDTYGIWYFDNGPTDAGVKNNWRIIESLQTADVSRTVLEAKAVSLQSKLLWNNLVGMYAERKDEQESWRRLQEEGVRGPTGSMARRLDDPGINQTDGNFNEALLFLEDTPFDVVEGDTKTWSIVGYYPEEWLGDLPWGMDLSAHLYEADSILPTGGQVNVLNEPLASPSGVTEEWGVTLSILENRLAIRFNKFKTSRKNARTNLERALGTIIDGPSSVINALVDAEEQGIPLFPSAEDALLTFDSVPNNLDRETGTDADLIGVNSYDEYYQRIIDVFPPSVQDIFEFEIIRNADGTIDYDRKPFDGALQSTQDFVAEGVEIDVVGRITDNWSISLNVAQQETVNTNTGPIAVPLFEEMLQRNKDLGLYNTRAFPINGSSPAFGAFFMERDARQIRLVKAKDGIASQEQREWRVTLVTRYDFREGFLKGFGVGASFRYQDAITAGYPNKWNEVGDAVADVDNPFLGPDELNGDLFVRYRKKLSEKLEWSIQFNARNLYRKNGDDDIPVIFNPDGRLAIIRIPNSQEFYLSNTFRF